MSWKLIMCNEFLHMVESKLALPVSKYCQGMCVEELRKTMKRLVKVTDIQV